MKKNGTGYRLSVPLMNRMLTDSTRPTYIRMLKDAGCDRVFIVFDRRCFFVPKPESFTLLSSNLAAMEDAGFEVAVWVQAFGFSDPMPPVPEIREAAKGLTRLRSVLGAELDETKDAFCPTDPVFMEKYLAYIRGLVRAGAKTVLLDDDLCLSVRPGIGCFCDEHLRRLNRRLGRTVPIGEWKDAFVGGANELRNAWADEMRDTLLSFADSVRGAINEIDPTVRCGFCAGYTSFDIEGADAVELTLRLAGGTEPLLRMTGAPYWSAKDLLRFGVMPLADIIESCRSQEVFCRGRVSDLFHEGDSYPRPRYHVFASYLEALDLALAASGGCGGEKYMLDYCARPDYETGYLTRHIKNLPLRRKLSEEVAPLPAVGVRVYDRVRKIRDAILPEPFIGEAAVMKRFFSPSASLLARHSIPTVYEGVPECGIAVGEEANEIGRLPKKLILDLPAAELLALRGYDLGFTTVTSIPTPGGEDHGAAGRFNYFNPAGRFFGVGLKPGATPVGTFVGGENPVGYRYASGGTEFLVYCCDFFSLPKNADFLSSYFRQEELFALVPVYPRIPREPFLWEIVKSDGERAEAVFLNLAEDTVPDPAVDLPDGWIPVDLPDGARCRDGKLTLAGDLPPYGCLRLSFRLDSGTASEKTTKGDG